jgi:hypothetical protein
MHTPGIAGEPCVSACAGAFQSAFTIFDLLYLADPAGIQSNG